jgi:hypothetical protein
VKQELRYWPPVWRHETHRLTDAAICGLPLFRLLIEEFQPPELVVEQRPDFREPGRWPDLGVKPREIPAGHHELGKELIAADDLPHALGFTHGPILPSALSAALFPVATAAANVQRVDPLEGLEAELAARGLRYAVDVSSGRCVIWVHGARLMVSLDNLVRQLTGTEHDREQISWFIDQVLAAAQPASLTAEGLSWCLEPSHYQESAEYRAAVSPRLDRVLVHRAGPGVVRARRP